MLYIVATPIGNLEDISKRAIEVLTHSDLILCEDTRVTKKLLERYEIKTSVMSFHQHSALSRIDLIIEKLKKGEIVSLVSDAGTPGVSDPGGKLVESVIQEIPDEKIIPIPGPSAIMAVLSISGFFADQFVFLGFPPHKKGRETWFNKLKEEKRVIVFYESVHRIKNALERMKDILSDRNIVLAREITKKFETVYRGKPQEVLGFLSDDKTLGEFVIVIDRDFHRIKDKDNVK
jgi:16S rRNA (cytidine1402-2'-O)-methyltransferase